MTYDLIIVSQSSHQELIANTQNAIDSCISEGQVNVILIETGQPYRYEHVDKWIEYNGEFNYNRALNMGLKYRKSDIQILANNDIIFQPGWSRIGGLMRANGYLSASALSNDKRQSCFQHGMYAYEGYGVGFHLSGWCIFCDSRLWDVIGQLDERYKFWFSDNAYADQLQAVGVKHAIICNVFVSHLGSRTLKKCNMTTRNQLTHVQRNHT